MLRYLLTIGATGLTLSSLDPRLYDGDGLVQVGTADLSLTEVVGSAGDYVLESALGLPPSGGRWFVTLNWPTGFGTVVSWPEWGTPTTTMLPIRATGMAAAIVPTHFVDEVPSGDSLSVSEAVGAGGDYLITGWDRAAGSHTVATDFGGLRIQVPAWDDAGGPTAGETIAQVEHESEVQYLINKWTRSALATFDQGVQVPDPGHGFDEISPISAVGIPFDPDEADGDSHAPFTEQDLRDLSTQDGVGFLAVELKPLRPPIVVSPGLRPEMREDYLLDILIVTPSRRGPDLANNYAGALAMLFRLVKFIPDASTNINLIRNLEPPAERPSPEGDDGSWRYDRLEIVMSRFYRAFVAGTAAA